MDLILVLVGVGAFPVACLAFVLWMGRFEEDIEVAVRRAARTPDPAPILAIPVRRPAPDAIPRQRAPEAAVGQRPEGSRSGAPVSLGGSTNL